MPKAINTFIFGLFILLLAACQTEPDVSVGSTAWQEWVDSVVQSGDGQGHGPDIGSDEWCSVIEHKLFVSQSGLSPCSAEWNAKVNDEISH